MTRAISNYWEIHARRYDRATLILNRRFGEMAGCVAESLSGTEDVLEIAAGTGLVTAGIAPVVGHLVATDATPAMLEILRARLASDRLTNVDVMQADALALPFADASFDAIVMANLLHLLPDPGRALAEVRRTLRPRGRLLAPTFCHGDTAVARIVSGALGLTGFRVVTRFAASELSALLQAHGFAVTGQRRFAGLLPLVLAIGERDELS